MARQQTVDVVGHAALRKAAALKLARGECVRIKAGGRFEQYGQKGQVTQREFRVCAYGGSGQPAAIQISTPGVRDRDQPYGTASRKILVGDTNKMCSFTSPGVHYEADLAPHRANIRELHGTKARRRRRRRK